MVSQFGSLGYTIMRKTADLTVVQKTIISCVYMDHNNPIVIGLKHNQIKKSHVNTSIGLNWPDLIKISIGS